MSFTLPPAALAVASSADTTGGVGTPTLWALLLAAVVALLALDFLITRRPHEVTMREAVAWSAFYIAIPLLFGGYVWSTHGSERGLEYYSGYLVEKSLSVDNLFVFMLLLSAFAVPAVLQQRVLLYGIIGALVLRGIFIALGAAALAAFDWVFLLFGADPGGHRGEDPARRGARHRPRDRRRPDAQRAPAPPVLPRHRGLRGAPHAQPGRGRRRALTPLAIVVGAVLATDIVFAVDSVPAVYGITGDPFLVFATNAFALLGLRSLYFVLQGALDKLVHLGFGLAAILAFIGAKLALHWGHLQWPWVPEIPTLTSVLVIVAILMVTTVTSLASVRRRSLARAHR